MGKSVRKKEQARRNRLARAKEIFGEHPDPSEPDFLSRYCTKLGVDETVGAKDLSLWGISVSEEQKKDYTITFKDETGNPLDTFPASAGETWGPSGDISVRSTYYKDCVDYDIVSGSGVGDLSAESACMQTGQSAPITGNMTFTYKRHTDAAASEKTYKCLTEDGTLLYMFTGSEKDIPQTLNPGNCVYTRTNKADDSTDESVVNVYYTLASDTDTNQSTTKTVFSKGERLGSRMTFRSTQANQKSDAGRGASSISPDAAALIAGPSRRPDPSPASGSAR